MLNDIIGTLSFLQPGLDDDFIDRLNYYHTSTFLIVVSIIVSFKMLAGRPLECWVPAEYTGSWEDYSEVFCWAQNTYYVPFDKHIPREIAVREFAYVSYYQWLPFFLLLIALMFYFPCILWRLFSSKSGVVLNDIVAVAKDKANISPETRQTNITGLAEHLLSVFRHKFRIKRNRGPTSLHRFAKCLNIRYYEAYMTTLYLFVKLLYLANSLGQLFLMNKFLQTDDYGIYGVGVLRDLISGSGWKESGNFPRVTMCDMQIRTMGNVQRHTVQCVLVINIFTEKIFILLWIWFTLLAVLNLFGLLYWLSSSIPKNERLRFIARHLELADCEFQPAKHREELKRFTSSWIKIDGIFVLRILNLQTGIMFTMELVDYMWDKFLSEQTKRQHEFDSKFPPKIVTSYHPNRKQGGHFDDVDAVSIHGEEEEENEVDTEIDIEGGTRRVNEDFPFLPPVSEREPRRKNSVFVPLVLPHSDRSRLPPPASSYRRKAFSRSKSTYH